MRRIFHIGASRGRVQREIDEEMRFHIDARIDALIRVGHTRDDAERLAVAEYGDVVAARTELASIDRRRLGKVAVREWIESLMQDVRFALRSLGAHPGFTLTVLLTLAIGIGANAAIFSVVDSVLVQQLPFTRPERLMHLAGTTTSRTGSYAQVSYPDYVDWRARSHAFTALGAYSQTSFVLGGDHPSSTSGVQVTSNFFDVLGVRPMLGRAFVDGEDVPDAPSVVLMSYGLWQRTFGGDRSAIGKVITLDGKPTTLVGVLPEHFHFRDNASDLWVPLRLPQRQRLQRGNRWLLVVGRLRDGESVVAARAEFSGITHELAELYPRSNAKHDARIIPLTDELVGSLRPLMLVLYGAVALLLLVACVNVANLLLMRGTDREREIAVRAALGAGRARLVRQLLTENLLLGFSGALLGLGVAYAGLRGLLRIIPPARVNAIPGLASASIDARVVSYVAAVSMLAVLLFGLMPALRSTRATTSLRGGERTNTRRSGLLRDSLVAAEVALTVLLVASAGLFGRSLMKLLAIQPGFRRDHVTTALIVPAGPTYFTAAPRLAFYRRLSDRLHAVPGVDAVGLVNDLPLEMGATFYYDIAGRPATLPGQSLSANVRLANAEYFQALGIPLVDGRAFGAADDETAPPVALINRALAQKEFRDEQPVGRYLEHFYFDDSVRVVGVVGNVPVENVEDAAQPTIYLSYPQVPPLNMHVVVRTRGEISNLDATIRDAVRSTDPDAAVTHVLSMDDVLEQSPSVFFRRFPLLLVGTFALITLLLAVIGVYGVVGYSVRQRTRELGIRMALGAQTDNVMGLVLRHGVRIAMTGVVIGLAATLIVTRFVSGILYGVGARDPMTLAAAGAVLTAAALGATLVPARRATRVDPAIALRAE